MYLIAISSAHAAYHVEIVVSTIYMDKEYKSRQRKFYINLEGVSVPITVATQHRAGMVTVEASAYHILENMNII